MPEFINLDEMIARENDEGRGGPCEDDFEATCEFVDKMVDEGDGYNTF